MTGDEEFSRILATASTLGDEADDRHRFVDKRVLLVSAQSSLWANDRIGRRTSDSLARPFRSIPGARFGGILVRDAGAA